MCQSEVSDYQPYFEENGIPEGADWYTVSTSVEPSRDEYPPSKWLSDAGWQLPVLLDDDSQSALRAFGLTAFPYTVVVDADGRIAVRATGALPIEALVEFTQGLSG